MAKHLTDRQKKAIVADYVECGNYREVSRKHKVSEYSVRQAVKNDPSFTQKHAQKKEQLEANLLERLETQNDTAFSLWQKCLKRLDEIIETTNDPQRLMTAAGIMIDKQTKRLDWQLKDREIAAKESQLERERSIDYTLIAAIMARDSAALNQDAAADRCIADFEDELEEDTEDSAGECDD